MVRFIAATVAVVAVLLPGAASADSLPAGNLLQNPSLESASGITPTCWSLRGDGNNTYVWMHTTDAHSGSYAEELTISEWSSGSRELLTARACASTVTPGDTYSLSAWYKVPSGSAGAPTLIAYYRNSSGNWIDWAHSSAFASQSAWTQASWTTPPVPSGVNTILVGMELTSAGSVTMDDFSLLDSSGADTSPPTAPSNLSATPGDGQVSLSWSASTDPDSTVAGYDVFRNGTQVAQVKGTTYTDTGLTDGNTYDYYVAAYDAAGNVSPASNTVPATPSAPSTGVPPTGFATVPSSGTGSPPAGIPRSDAACAAAVTPTGEKRPSNTTANNTVPADPTAIPWNPAWESWPAFVSDRNLVTGDFTGTTDEILQWAACKWGIDVNVARADAWLESGWYQSLASGCAGPEASFGLFQIMAEDCNGDMIHGGWPYVQDDTALNADYWGAWIRGCFDGAFLTPGQPWQNSPAQGYGGQSMAQIVAVNGEDYALWGCIGAWFSNAWYSSAAQGYITTVQNDYASQLWLQPGT